MYHLNATIMLHNATKPEVIENMICEGTDHLKAALNSGMTSLWVMVAEVWAGGAMKQCHCFILYLGQTLWFTEWKHRIKNIPDSQHWWESSFTQHITLLPFVILRSVSILSGYPVTNIWCFNEGRKLPWFGPMSYHRHTVFHYSKILICLNDMVALAIFQAWFCVGLCKGKCLIFMHIRHMVRLFK